MLSEKERFSPENGRFSLSVPTDQEHGVLRRFRPGTDVDSMSRHSGPNERHKETLAMMIKIKKFLDDNVGANLVEYIILVGVIALVAIAGFKIFGEKVDKKVQDQASKVEQIGN